MTDGDTWLLTEGPSLSWAGGGGENWSFQERGMFSGGLFIGKRDFLPAQAGVAHPSADPLPVNPKKSEIAAPKLLQSVPAQS